MTTISEIENAILKLPGKEIEKFQRRKHACSSIKRFQ